MQFTQTLGSARKLIPILGLVFAVSLTGCSRDRSTDIDTGDSSGEIDEAVAADSIVQEFAGRVEWTKGNERASIDLRDVSPDDLPKAVAATVMIPGVEEVQLKGAAVDDPIALPIVGIKTLRRLRLTDTQVTDTTLEKVGDVGQLQLLHLHGAPELTPDAWQHLSKLSELKDLSLSGDNVDDRVVAPLAKLPKLKKVRLRGTAITGENFTAMGDTPVVDLELAETEFGNAGMSAVAAMPKLTKLNLWLTRVDDEGVEVLRDNQQLTSLNLDNMAGITDEAIDVITTIPNLTFLHLGKTKITEEGVARLKTLQKLETIHITNLGVPEDVIKTLRDEIPTLQSVVN